MLKGAHPPLISQSEAMKKALVLGITSGELSDAARQFGPLELTDLVNILCQLCRRKMPKKQWWGGGGKGNILPQKCFLPPFLPPPPPPVSNNYKCVKMKPN